LAQAFGGITSTRSSYSIGKDPSEKIFRRVDRSLTAARVREQDQTMRLKGLADSPDFRHIHA